MKNLYLKSLSSFFSKTRFLIPVFLFFVPFSVNAQFNFWHKMLVYNYANADVPVGAVLEFLGDTCPSNYINLNQKHTLSKSTYPKLFQQAKRVHGNGDGVDTFETPNLAGLVTRGSGSQNLNGVVYNAPIAQARNDAIQNITGTFDLGVGDSGSRLRAGSSSGAIHINKIQNSRLVTTVNYSTNDYSGTISFDASRVVRADTQTHPADYVLIKCVRAF